MSEEGLWLYIRSEPQLWTVGHYDPNGKFNAESDHPSSEEAAARVHYLNGGLSPEEKKALREPAAADTDPVLRRSDLRLLCHFMLCAATEKRRHFPPGQPEWGAYQAEVDFWLSLTDPDAEWPELVPRTKP